jgi:hypothetical protein
MERVVELADFLRAVERPFPDRVGAISIKPKRAPLAAAVRCSISRSRSLDFCVYARNL